LKKAYLDVKAALATLAEQDSSDDDSNTSNSDSESDSNTSCLDGKNYSDEEGSDSS
jgi:hypothetical protein